MECSFTSTNGWARNTPSWVRRTVHEQSTFRLIRSRRAHVDAVIPRLGRLFVPHDEEQRRRPINSAPAVSLLEAGGEA